jgi:gliding motility-associated-like protein
MPSYYGKDSLTYRVTNTDIEGRFSEAKIHIIVGNVELEDFVFLLPNAFSPNGDGMNDLFVIDGLGDTETSMLEVFNRWGTIVYRSQGVRYENDWDGKINMKTMITIGDELPSGVYMYVFKVKKNIPEKGIVEKEFRGFIELRR